MKNINIAFPFFLNILSFFLLPAQKALVKGTISDATTKETLVGAVIITNTQEGTTTNDHGYFELYLDAGLYEIEFRYVSYENANMKIELSPGQIKELNVFLNPDEGILNTIVVTGSKFEKKIGEEVVTIDVIKPDLIEHANDVSIESSLEKIPGMNVIDGQANIRGGSGYSYGAGSRVLLLMDDLPLLTGDAAFPSWNFVPIENISQVEIIKGASSALYGSSALNGIINVRTAYPGSEPETKFSFFNGLYTSPKDTAQKWWDNNTPFFAGANFAHRQKFGKFDLVTGAYLYFQDSYLKGEYDRRGRWNLNTRYRVNNNLAIGININAQLSTSSSFFFWHDIDSGLYIPADNTLSYNDAFKLTVDPFLTYYGKNGIKHKILSRYFRNHNANLSGQGSNSDLAYAEYQFQKIAEKINLVITAGAVANYTFSSAELYSDSSFTATNEAFYFQADKKFFDRLNLSSGMRYEINQIGEIQESRPVFRFGANYQVADYTYIRSSWGQGYRFPTIAEKYISTTVSLLSVIPNHDLKSETGWSAELGIKQGLKFSEWTGYLDLSAFMSEYDNMMEFTFGYYPGEGPGLPYGFKSLNIGNTRIKGIEIALLGEGNIGNFPTTVIAGYTYIDPKFQHFDSLENASSSADYNILKYRFKHTAKMDVETTIKKFRIGLSANYFSFMEAVDAAFVDPIPILNVYIIPGLEEYRVENNSGEIVFDLRLAYLFSNGSEIAMLCNNIANNEYTIRPAREEAPRNFTVKYSIKF